MSKYKGPIVYRYNPEKMYIDHRGYPRYKNSNKLVHRQQAEKKIGRKLEHYEVVHHINENKMDFNPNNLQVFEGRTAWEDHAKIHNQSKNVLSSNIEEPIILIIGIVIFLSFIFILTQSNTTGWLEQQKINEQKQIEYQEGLLIIKGSEQKVNPTQIYFENKKTFEDGAYFGFTFDIVNKNRFKVKTRMTYHIKLPGVRTEPVVEIIELEPNSKTPFKTNGCMRCLGLSLSGPTFEFLENDYYKLNREKMD